MDTYISVVKKLEQFGLSQKQSYIYLLLVKHGELRIQEIANLAKIPRSSIYGHLKELQKLGLINEIVDNKLIRLKPYPVGFMKHMFNEKISRLQKLINDLKLIEKKITIGGQTISSPLTQIRYYRNVSGARQIFWNTLEANDKVYVYSSYGRSKYVGVKFYMDFVEESLKRNIQEKVLINPTNHALNLIRRDTGTSLARTDPKDIRFMRKENLLLKGEVFIYNNIYAQVYLSETEIHGFEIESENIIKTQHSIFETLWKMGRSVMELIKNT